MPDQATVDAIVRAAQEAGIDPAYALAVTERESDFNPNAKASKTIYGLQQMSAPERAKYGSGDSTDPYVQSKAWAAYMQDVNSEMAKTLGRSPTPQESYLGHYWGGTRAARIASGQIPPETPTSQVFSPTELKQNPEIAKAGTVGALQNKVIADINRRMGSYADYSRGSTSPTQAGYTPGAAGAINKALDYSVLKGNLDRALGQGSKNPPPMDGYITSIPPDVSMQLQNPGISPNADAYMEQTPPSIEQNREQTPLDVPQPPPPQQQVNASPMMQQLGSQVGGQSQQSQAPTTKMPRSVNQLSQLSDLYPQKLSG